MANRKAAFTNLTVTELVHMRAQIDRLLDQKIAAERRELQARLMALSDWEPSYGRRGAPPKGHGTRAANGRRRAHPLKGRKAPIKFRGPSGEKWSGRGLAPRWLVALEKKGRKRERFLVGR